MSRPTRYLAALLALVDTAEQRPLTAEEAGRLRTQLHALDANRRRVGGMTTAISRERQAARAQERPSGAPGAPGPSRAASEPR